MATLRRWRLPLLASLLLVTALELVTHRVVLQFLKPQVLQPESNAFRLFNNGVGPLAFFFASFLALAVCTWMLIVVVREDGLFTLPWRIVLGLFTCVFLPICAVGAFVSPAGLRPPGRSLVELHPYVNLFFAPMAGAIAAGILLRRGPILARVGVVLWVVPLLAFAYFSHRTATLLAQQPAGAPIYEPLQRVALVPQWCRTLLTLSGFWVFLCFYPLVELVDDAPPDARPARFAILGHPWRTYLGAVFEAGPLAVGLILAAVAGVGIKSYYGWSRIVADGAFAYDLPTASAGALLPLISVALFSWTVAGLAWRRGPTRTAALGLVALLVAGYRLSQPLHDLQLAEPLYYLLAVVGLLSVSSGIAGAWDLAQARALAAASPPIPDVRWRRYLGAASAALAGGPGDAVRLVQLEDGGAEISGLEGRWRGVPLSVLLRRRDQRVLALSIVLGEALEQPADWSVSLARVRGGGEDGEGPHRLEVHDRAELSERLLREGMGDRLRELIRGRVEVWLHVGLRYDAVVGRTEDLSTVLPLEQLADESVEDPPVGRLLALCDVLQVLVSRAGVRSPITD